ncbi:MAG: hypothetical protein M1835_007878 [Candelina submexicana]|nr:MAG: hypothetical protein M1835_007878 [Candelina submexicana]
MAVTEPEIYDVIIIGAGPCGLATAARLCESSPSSLFTDIEHQRYHWIKKHDERMSIKSSRRGSVRSPKCPISVGGADCPGKPRLPYTMLVLDSTAGEWCGKWNKLFKAFCISHLRSPMFFHPDPRDRDGLLAYAYEQARENELREITNVVGKELSKHKRKIKMNPRDRKGLKRTLPTNVEVDERNRSDYFTPSSDLFSSYCCAIEARYHLKDIVRKAEVHSVDFGPIKDISTNDNHLFSVETSTGVQYARTVVLAVGPGGKPILPRQLSTTESEGACHSSQISPGNVLPIHVRAKISRHRETNVVVVGGGLTSCQLGDLLVKRGVSKVWYLMRTGLKVKPFDLDLQWLAKYKNLQTATFWSADDDDDRKERLGMVQEARNGGSITPIIHKVLQSHIRAGKVSLHTHTIVTSQHWDHLLKSWTLITSPEIPDLPTFDYIYYATGISSDFSTLSLVQKLLAKVDLPIKGGLPCLTDDLMLADNVPCFVTGRLAALRVGPGAGNLEGARAGAERIAWKIQELLGSNGDTDAEQQRGWHAEVDGGLTHNLGLTNSYGALADSAVEL